MKKYNIRHIAFIILITASIFSYSYLSCVHIEPAVTKSSIKTEEKINVPTIYTPDIALSKKLINILKVLIPSNK